MMQLINKYLDSFCFKRLVNDKALTDSFLNEKRALILSELYKYPSFINNGYLHFEKLFEIATHYNLINNDGLILDVGGADGITAIKFHEKFVNSTVFVFEPLQENINVLQKNITPYKRIRLFQTALGDEKKQSQINITKRITSSSLLAINTSEFKDDYMSSQLVPENTELINLDTLDNLITKDKKVIILKIDVQGFELEVLKGGTTTLQNTSLVMVELQNHKMYLNAPMYYEVDAHLRKSNFTLLQYIPSLRNKHKQEEWDAVYIHNNLL